MGGPRKTYTAKAILDTILRVKAGEDRRAVAASAKISYSVLNKEVAKYSNGEPIVRVRRGPAPLLPREVETCLEEWIVGMQSIGSPVDAADIIRKAEDISLRMFGHKLGRGWYQRFIARHPGLATRQAQVVSRARNEINAAVVMVLFHTMLKLIVELGITADRVFNVDETSFLTRRRSRHIIARKGSANVWTMATATNFHLTIVACASASGFVLPPLFVLPGERVSVEAVHIATTAGAAIATTATGFMTTGRFLLWLQWFAETVPSSVKRLLVLVMDGCASHFSVELVAAAMLSEVLLVCLPANGTHLLQPLDVSCFSSIKKDIQQRVSKHLQDHGGTTVPKEAALDIGCKAVKEGNLSENIVSGFEATGLFPLSIVRIRRRVALFKGNGVVEKRALWLKHKEYVQEDVLVLPPLVRDLKKKRKSLDVGGKLLTQQLFEMHVMEEQAVKDKKAAEKERKAAAKRATTTKRTSSASGERGQAKKAKKTPVARLETGDVPAGNTTLVYEAVV